MKNESIEKSKAKEEKSEELPLLKETIKNIGEDHESPNFGYNSFGSRDTRNQVIFNEGLQKLDENSKKELVADIIPHLVRQPEELDSDHKRKEAQAQREYAKDLLWQVTRSLKEEASKETVGKEFLSFLKEKKVMEDLKARAEKVFPGKGEHKGLMSTDPGYRNREEIVEDVLHTVKDVFDDLEELLESEQAKRSLKEEATKFDKEHSMF